MSMVIRQEEGLTLRDADALITHIEVNDKHGVGVQMRMLFRGRSNILSIRSANHFDGQHDLGGMSLCISHGSSSRDAVFSRVLAEMGRSTVRRILCLPYYPDDVRTAVAVKEIFGVPLCTYLNDDQNVCGNGIPDELMRELLAKSALRLASCPQLRAAYELKYGCEMWYMPPLVADSFILSRLNAPEAGLPPDHGVIIGNIWGRRWLELLRKSVRGSGISLSWYCNSRFRTLSCQREDLLADSIFPYDPCPDEELIGVLRRTSFAVLPTGTLDEKDDRSFIAQLSLPSRLIYLMATAQIPVLVLGNRRTAAARFVEQFGIGIVADYGRRSFVEAVGSITRPETNLEMRRRALAAAGRFTDTGAMEWIWQSLERGKPIDQRYEDLMPRESPDLSHLTGGNAPAGS
jgi:hypothetical protein